MAGHNNEDNKGKEDNKKLKIIAGIVVLVFIVLVGVIVFLLSRQGQGVQDEGDKRSQSTGTGTVVDPEKGLPETVQPSTEEESTDNEHSDLYFVQMASDIWHFESGDMPSYDAVVSNADINDCNVYFDVTLVDTGEVVLSSPVLKPGEMMAEITLGTVLESGTYDAVLVYHMLDLETDEEYSDLRLAITIIIE